MKLPNSALILAHYYAYGPADDLERLLSSRIHRLMVVKVPLFLESNNEVYVRVYEKGRLYSWKARVAPRLHSLQRIQAYILSLLRLHGYTFDMAIGQDPIVTFIGLGLRRAGIVQKVVFHSHSYTAPARGAMYRLIDRIATIRSDTVWALSRRLAGIRKLIGARRVIHVPVCIRDDVLPASTSRRDRSIVFIGRLSRDKGIDVLLKSIPRLLESFDKIVIVGKGPYEKVLARLSSRREIMFMGPRPLAEAMKIAAEAALGLVLSRPSLEVLTTDPMKPKVYLAAGTPIIIPPYLELSSDVARAGAGALAYPKPSAVADAAARVAKNLDDSLSAARELARKNDYWKCSTILLNALKNTMEE